MKSTFLKSFLAMLAMATMFAFVGCEENEEGGSGDLTIEVSTDNLAFTQAEESKTLDIATEAKWVSEIPSAASSWVTVTPKAGKGNKTVTISVAANTTGAARSAELKFWTLHPEYGQWEAKRVNVSQSASEVEIEELEQFFFDNFDKVKAEQDGNYWPYFDATYANPTGDGAATVSYDSNNITARANSTSNSNYSDYAGSGYNNLFFGKVENFVAIKDITLPSGKDCYVLTFGAEKYNKDNGSVFSYDEFHVYVSGDNAKWSEVTYAFEEGDDIDGRWNDATASFKLTTVPEKLSIKFVADMASSYRLDDVTLYSGGEGAQVVDLSQGGAGTGGSGSDTPSTPSEPLEGTFFSDNFDKTTAVKDGNYWPYFDATYANPVGDGAATVSYDSTNITARANSESNGTYSDYAGSGKNNLFFGKVENFVAIKDITLPSGEDTFFLTFGAAKYTQSGDSTFSYDEFHVYLSGDNTNWVEIDYAFASGDNLSGRWNDATANFKITNVPAKLSIKFSADVASVYRLDDVALGVADSASQEVTLGEGGGSTGGQEPGQGGDEPAGTEVTVTEAISAAKDSAVKVKESTVVAVSARSYLLTDGTSYILAYKGDDPGLAVGDKVTVEGKIGAYRSVPQITSPVATKTGHDDSFAHPEVTVMDGAAIDAYAAMAAGTTYIKYVKVEGELVKSDAYWNLKVEGASTGQGSISYPSATMCPDSYSGKKVTVYGYTIYQTRDTDVNIIATQVVVDGEGSGDQGGNEGGEGGEDSGDQGGNEGGDDSGDQGGNEGEQAGITSVADFLAAATDEDGNTTVYTLKGTITSVANTTYGNFDLTDDTGTVYIYGLCSPDGATNKYWATSGAKLGDDIVIKTVRGVYNGTPQGKNALFVELVSPGTRAFWNPESAALTLAAAGESKTVKLNAYNIQGDVTVASNNAAITATYANDIVTISAGANSGDVINATVTVSYGKLSHTISVTQLKQSTGGDDVQSVTVKKVMAECGWANSTAVTKLEMDNNITVTFEKGGANNAPAYYTSGAAVRLYQNGAIMTVTASNGKVIKAINLTFAEANVENVGKVMQNFIGTTEGTLTINGGSGSWVGEAGSVKFTSTGTDKGSRAYIAAIEVVYE